MSKRQLIRDFEGRRDGPLRRAFRLSAQVLVVLVGIWVLLLLIA